MHRRAFCTLCATALGTGLGATLGPRAGVAGADDAAWQAWASRFVAEDGRIVDDGQGGISHSEGQGYGLLLAQAFGDRDRFAAIEGWSAAHLAIRDDALMAWKWTPGSGATDWHSATDGDLFRAWALARAARDSGWSEWDGRAAPIARAIAALCLAADPRAPGEPVLTPGAEAPRGPRLIVNPSYLMVRALRETGAATDTPELIRAADHGETLLAELAARGPLPDWTGLGPEGFAAAPGYGANFSYDALRIGLYLCWSGRAAHPAVARARADMTRLPEGAPQGAVAVTVSPAGAPLAFSDLPGYRALARLLGGETPADTGPTDTGPPAPTPADTASDILRQPYYPATLQMLARIARREGQSPH